MSDVYYAVMRMFCLCLVWRIRRGGYEVIMGELCGARVMGREGVGREMIGGGGGKGLRSTGVGIA
jgi:hypothetical protein